MGQASNAKVKKRPFNPCILTPQEVRQLIDSTFNLKHRAILSTTYSAGLRVSEVCNLKITDIDNHNMCIHVRMSKGFKSRVTLLSKRNLLLLREYYKAYTPNTWLFPGANPQNPLSTRTAQTTFLEACQRCGIVKDVSIHSLRHSFATHLMENGANIRQIQSLMGHGNINTTAQYIHLTRSHLVTFQNPMDLWE
ncbi:MAG: tyrosine-type recombinase/integrase [Candidatus Bathyarchaeota archaeon]|nr:tyrosine-type recombinase/integrase [Candidatus Bathyarchaeota archaeon]